MLCCRVGWVYCVVQLVLWGGCTVLCCTTYTVGWVYCVVLYNLYCVVVLLLGVLLCADCFMIAVHCCQSEGRPVSSSFVCMFSA